MEFGLTFDKLLLIGLVAVLIIGPERLPKAAEAFSKFVRRAGEYLRDTKDKMKDELGPEIDEVDWRKLDPRQYDPRRIIRDALFEEPSFDSAPSAPATSNPFAADPVVESAAPSRAPRTREFFTRATPPPFDAEAT
ncbi:twin-arginine translocase TatA/TatE family subunit [Microbacterium sp.]|jgi:sec-independent protein translocase protein TatB|uniref:twin-arginine translocase TatA/TatE family subunit n=1 Tax=Microbacterium sp. TaxID=51671 RepID=UPI002634D327|nr:twin-arginine translocase TatA/TatE family subunit [uncultured Microbacterium sp.]